ncbi:unnamed protein product, partial [Mesorhabditis spiculigera]
MALHQAFQDKSTAKDPRQTDALKLQARRHYVFDSNQRTCDESVIELIPSIRRLIEVRFNVEAIKKEIDANPDMPLELKLQKWEKMKLTSFARILALAYSYSLLTVTLKCQISILAADICTQFEKPREPVATGWSSYLPPGFANYFGSSAPSTSEPQKQPDVGSQQIFMQCIQYFTSTGIQQLFDNIEKAMEESLQNITLKQQMSKDEVRAIFESAEKRIFSEDGVEFCQLVAPLDENMNMVGETLQNLIRRLVRSLKSTECKDTTRALADYYLSTACGRIPGSSPAPLAKLIPPLSDTFHSISSTSFESPLRNSLCSSDVHQLAIAVFSSKIA